jgi:hypothetical protein
MSLQRTLFFNYDVPADLTYGRFFDQVNLRGFAATSGSSVTTTAVESSGDGATPFDVVQVGDWLMQESLVGTQLFRSVATKTSSTSITVDSVWTLGAAGKALKLFPFRSGTTALDGACFIGTSKNATIAYNLTTLGAASVRIVVEVKMSDPNAVWTTLFDQTLVATGSDSFSITEPWSFIRVGLEEVGAAGTDVISVYLTVDDNVTI